MEQRTISPEEHLNRVSKGRFPQDTRDFLCALVNAGLRDPRHVRTYVQLTSKLGRYQRDEILRELWLSRPERSDLARASSLISGFQRFNGRVTPGKPETALYERLRALELAGVRMPGVKQVIRICA